MDLAKMLDKCRREQWHLDDLDWSGTPRSMSRHDEIAIVQYFTDMAQIERLAGALFREQERKVEDQTLKAIFRTFVVDEERHARAAERLAKYYDVHRYQVFTVNPSLRAFFPSFITTIRRMPPDIANVYITTGELILDVALLRSINDHVNDAMSHRAMDLINRDESRHIAVDYHMVEYYASDEYEQLLARAPKPALADRARAAAELTRMLWFAAPCSFGRWRSSTRPGNGSARRSSACSFSRANPSFSDVPSRARCSVCSARISIRSCDARLVRSSNARQACREACSFV
jgi:hypothetical protein